MNTNFSYNLFGIESTNLVLGYDLLEKILFFIYWRKIFLPEIQEKAHRHRVNLAYLINSWNWTKNLHNHSFISGTKLWLFYRHGQLQCMHPLPPRAINIYILIWYETDLYISMCLCGVSESSRGCRLQRSLLYFLLKASRASWWRWWCQRRCSWNSRGHQVWKLTRPKPN